jgi:hypothetical protein
MANKIQVKRGVEANIPILDVGEPAFTTDTKKLFIGTDTGNMELATKEQINSLDANKADKTEVNTLATTKANVTDLNQTNNNVNATNLRIDNLVIPISPENVNVEVTDAHNSIVKNKNFVSLKARLEESEQDLAEHKLDYASQRQQDQLLFDGKIENRKPNYGVDSQSYYERRDRLPYTANEYFKAPISNPNTDIDGYSAFGQKHAPGAIFGITNTFETPIDMTNCQYISFDYYCTDLNLASIRIDLRSGSVANYFRHRLKLANLEIGVNHIILNKSDFTEIGGSPSWNNITSVYIRGEVSSVGSHTWAIGDVHIYRFIPTITLWFDDQLKSVYTVAKPIMDTYGFLGVQSVIGARVNLGPAYQAPLELAEMVASGWEHTNHTFIHEKFGETTLERAVYSLQRGLDYCLSHGFGKGSYYFVNPGGQSTPETEPYEKKYSTLRRRGIGINKFPIVDMYDIKSREPAWSDNFNPTVKAWVDDAVLNGHWLILLFHGIKPSSEGSASSFWSTENFTALCQYLSQQQALGNLHVRTCTEALLKI